MSTTTLNGQTFPERTSTEIRAYYDGTRDHDYLGFIAEVLLPRCDYGDVADLLKPEVTRELWEVDQEARDPESLQAEMTGYLEFAWGKARDHRGISAGRSLQKLQVFAWLLGDDEGADTIREMSETDYYPYGAPVLSWIASRYDFLPNPPDGGLLARMAAGQPCSSDCTIGC